MKPQKTLIPLCIILILSLSNSCKTDAKRQSAEQIVAEWIGKTIQFPDNMQLTVYGRDTMPAILSDTPYKVLVYIDSTGCTSCRLKLLEWHALILEADTVMHDRLSFLFCYYPKNRKELEYLFLRDRFDYPVFVDQHNEMDKLNKFPKRDEYQCFLLDQNDRVVAIGNPIFNPRIWDLYKQIVEEKQQPSD